MPGQQSWYKYSCFRSPQLAPAAEEPEQEQAGEGAGGVNEDIAQTAFAVGNEGLVEFIGGGVERGDPEDFTGLQPAPRSGVAQYWFAAGAPDQPGEDGVFAQVRALAYGEDEAISVIVRDAGK